MRVYLALSATLLLTLSGCGSVDPNPRAAVKGTVLFDGKPLPQGTVRFCPIAETSGPKISIAVVDGKFEAAPDSPDALKPVVGKHRIEIEATDPSLPAMDDEEAVTKFVANARQTGQRITVFRVPPEFNEKSTLEANVSADGPNEFQFDLKSRR